ncbi:MAG: helix-turn-helix domain-containing protein [Candidatus Nitrosotenuis sp.]
MRNARIIDVARQGSTISGIAHQTGIPFPTVRRAIYAFENIGVIKATKIGKKVFVKVTNRNHPVVNSMVESAKWINSIVWDPDTFVARMFEKHHINYAFVGTSKIKYTKNESRNMVQVAVPKKFHSKAREIINEGFNGIGIRTTEDPRQTIGNASSVIYVKCFPVDDVNYEERIVRMADSNENITIRIADNDTEKNAMQQGSREDMMFVPPESAV